MRKVLMITLLRCDSSRTPNKCVLDLGGKPTFVQIFERGLEGYPNPDLKAVVTPLQMVNDPAALLAREYGYDVVRTHREPCREQLCSFDYYGLDDDDIYIALPCDAPLQYTKHLGFAVEQFIKHEAEISMAVMRRGTLGWAVYAIGPWTVGHYRRITKHQHMWEHGTVYCNLDHHGRYLLIELPPYLDTPWPWGPLNLDFPAQAVMHKAIYEELYDGKPIDVRDVFDYFTRTPTVANMVEPDTIRAYNQIYPLGDHELLLAAVKHRGDYVEVKFEEGGDETDNLAGKCVK